MSELEQIEIALLGARRRRLAQRLWKGFWVGLFVGAVLWTVIYGTYKLLPLPGWVLTGAAVVSLVVLLGNLVVAGWERTSLLQTARWLDLRQGLKERLSTALELAGDPAPSEWRGLVLKDAAEQLSSIRLAELAPLRLPRVATWALLAVLLAAGLGFVPEYRTERYRRAQEEAALVRETGKKLGEFIRQDLQQRPAVLDTGKAALEMAGETAEKLARSGLTRPEALRELSSVTEKLNQQLRELGDKPAIKSLKRPLEQSGGASSQTPEQLQQQIAALQSKLGKSSQTPDAAMEKLQASLEKARQSLSELNAKDPAAQNSARQASSQLLSQLLSQLAEQMRDLGIDASHVDEAIQALERNQTELAIGDLQNALNDLSQVRQMAKALQQLQDKASQIGKDLAEQLQNGQLEAARSTLKKMEQELTSPGLSPERAAQLTEEIGRASSPGQQYGNVGGLLKEAAEQAGQGRNAEAAQSLAAAARELERMAQQLADVQSMLDSLGALDRAQLAIATGRGWDQMQPGNCPACNGRGCSRCRPSWGQGGKPGAGVGTWADESAGWSDIPEFQTPADNSGIVRPDMDPRGHTGRDSSLPPNLTPTKITGQPGQGGPMPSITLKGVSIKGQSTVEYQAAAAAAQSQAESALNQDQVPKAYRSSVRDYFDDLKK